MTYDPSKSLGERFHAAYIKATGGTPEEVWPKLGSAVHSFEFVCALALALLTPPAPHSDGER